MQSELVPFQSGQKVLFLHAHPDDESLATGALIAALVAHGVQCDLLTATRGEEGEIVSGVLPAGTSAVTLAAHREKELALAADILGISRRCFLGALPARAQQEPRNYRDSGMRWITPTVAGAAAGAHPNSLVLSSKTEALQDCLAVVATWQPDILVSYNSHGGYGHPDHVRMHEITAQLAAVTGLPAYQIEHNKTVAQYWFELPHTREQVQRALKQYGTQLTVSGNTITHSGGQQEAIATAVGLSRLG